jgi:hypothetical protein
MRFQPVFNQIWEVEPREGRGMLSRSQVSLISSVLVLCWNDAAVCKFVAGKRGQMGCFYCFCIITCSQEVCLSQASFLYNVDQLFFLIARAVSQMRTSSCLLHAASDPLCRWTHDHLLQVLQCSVWTPLEGLELVQLLQCLLILSPMGISVGIVCPEGLCCCSGKLTFLRMEG